MDRILAVILLVLCVASSLAVKRPPSIDQGPEGRHFIFKDDSSFSIRCIGSGSPHPEFEWTKDGSILDFSIGNYKPDSDKSVGTLHIEGATRYNEGVFQCLATNQHGKAVSDTIFVQRAVQYTDSSSSDVIAYHADEGESLVVPCRGMVSVPEAQYGWATSVDAQAKDQTDLTFSRRVNINEQGDLYFSYVTMEDYAGGYIYKCISYNSIIDQSQGGSYSKVNVRAVSDPPDVKPAIMYTTSDLDPGNPVIAVAGRSLVLKCLFSGKPEANIVWGRNNGRIQGETISEQFTKMELHDVKESDEDTYYCDGSNSVGSYKAEILVEVVVAPQFDDLKNVPGDVNATEGEDVEYKCETYADPKASVKWSINGEPLEDYGTGPQSQFRLSSDGKILTVLDVCKDCADPSLMNVYCNASNDYGYAFAGGYLNVLLKTVITKEPESVDLKSGANDTTVYFECEAETDPSTKLILEWLKDNAPLDYDHSAYDWNRETNTLSVHTKYGMHVAGTYKCVAHNYYTNDTATAMLTIEGATPGPIIATASSSWWVWVLIGVAILLLLLILLLCGCLYAFRNKGDAYKVDKTERKHGNDPEKDLLQDGFTEYQRPEDLVKSSRASLTDVYKTSDDEGSLDEYGDPSMGKFNEDGSFIGEYQASATSQRDNTSYTNYKHESDV